MECLTCFAAINDNVLAVAPKLVQHADPDEELGPKIASWTIRFLYCELTCGGLSWSMFGTELGQ